MGGGFASRFVLEVAFLALLAAAAALADFEPAKIVGVMAVGWLLVTLIEWLAWRSERRLHVPKRSRAPVAEEPPEQAADQWALDDILAPVAEDDENAGPATGADAGQTSVLPPREK